MIHQAIAAAYAGRGVAHLTLPQDVLCEKAVGQVQSIETLKHSDCLLRPAKRMLLKWCVISIRRRT